MVLGKFAGKQVAGSLKADSKKYQKIDVPTLKAQLNLAALSRG